MLKKQRDKKWSTKFSRVSANIRVNPLLFINMNFNHKKYVKISVIAIVIVIVVVLGFVASQKGWLKPLSKIVQPGNGIEGAPATGLPTIEGGTRDEISKTVQTPEPGATPTNPEVAVPKSSLDLGGSEGVNASLRDFELKAENGKFFPSTIVVNEMDVITISLTAVDQKYNIFFPDFGVYREAAKGQTTKFQFQAYPFGQYKFYCKDICGSGATGALIVNKK